MAGRDIRGISVSIGGDTTKLQSALQGVNKEIKFPRLLVGGGGRLHGRPKDCLRLLFFYGSVLVFPNADSGVKMIHFCFLLHVRSPTRVTAQRTGFCVLSLRDRAIFLSDWFVYGCHSSPFIQSSRLNLPAPVTKAARLHFAVILLTLLLALYFIEHPFHPQIRNDPGQNGHHQKRACRVMHLRNK